MRNRKNGWLLIGVLAGMIIGRLTIPDEVWGAEPVLIVPDGTTIIEDMNHPSMTEIDEAVEYLSANGVEVPEEIKAICEEVGKEYNLCPELLEAVCWKESWFKADITNASGTCFGLMQIHRESHRARMQKLGVTDLYDPEQNIRTGADYLSELFAKYGDMATALESYNGDSGAASDPTRTSSYAQKILNVSQALERANWK